MITIYLDYQTCDPLSPHEVARKGRRARVFYRLHLPPEDAEEVYRFFIEDVTAKLDDTEIANRMIKEALATDGYPRQLTMHCMEFSFDSQESHSIEFPQAEKALVYQRVPVELPNGSHSQDWVRTLGGSSLRLLGKGKILADPSEPETP